MILGIENFFFFLSLSKFSASYVLQVPIVNLYLQILCFFCRKFIEYPGQPWVTRSDFGCLRAMGFDPGCPWATEFDLDCLWWIVFFFVLQISHNMKCHLTNIDFLCWMQFQRVRDSWRVVNHRDIIPTVPRLMGYCHIGQPIYLSAGTMNNIVCAFSCSRE
jgi:hypothetical protein